MTIQTAEITREGAGQTPRTHKIGSGENMTIKTANRYTSKDNTYQYTCTALLTDQDGEVVGECGRKYSVGEFIVTGTHSPEQLKARGGRKAGFCHCGAKISTEFECTKNVMWSLKVDDEETSFRPLRTLTRVEGGSDDSGLSPQFLAMKQRLDADPTFARGVQYATAKTLARMLTSTSKQARLLAASKLSEEHCDALLSLPNSHGMAWFEDVLGRKEDFGERSKPRPSRERSKPKAASSHLSEIFSHKLASMVGASA